MRTTEWSDESNWVNERKPCRLLERVILGGAEDSPLVTTLDSSYGPISSLAREIVLSSDGALLLETDQEQEDHLLSESLLNAIGSSGQCHDDVDGMYYELSPHPDHLSWFNPSNWQSLLIDFEDMTYLAPQSHQIPCTEDVVVFGSKHLDLESIVEENDEPLGFKVNFRASQAEHSERNSSFGSLEDSLRVSKLIIGQRSYSQDDLEELFRSYGDSLFEIAANQSVLRRAKSFLDGADPLSPIIIDETSIQTGKTHDLCLEEAGCMCGNEKREIMDILCSFNEPLQVPDDYPCYDPISVTGYCDKICATNLIINMDPSKFSERFVSNLVTNLLHGFAEQGDRLGESLFSGARRVDHSRYEITLRIFAYNRDEYSDIIGNDLKVANLLKETLERRK